MFLSIEYPKVMHFYGVTEHIGIKDTEFFSFDVIFRSTY